MPSVSLVFLNVGRRVELIRGFREAFNQLNIEGRIIGTDIDPWAPGLYEVDEAVLLPRSSDEAFVGMLAKLCSKLDVKLIIPLIDPDLRPLVTNRDILEQNGTRVLLSPSYAVEICRDKRKLYAFLTNDGFRVPRVFNIGEVRDHPFPLFVKPWDGSASLSAFKVANSDELRFFSRYVPNAIIQEFIDGDEITVDVFSDWSGRPLLASPRKRIKVRAGEVSVGCMERDRSVEELALAVAERLKTVGPVNVQILRGREGLYVSEVNPRFGGGVPLSIAAGAPFPEWTISLALGQSIQPHPIRLQDRLSMLRFDQSRFLPMQAIIRYDD